MSTNPSPADTAAAPGWNPFRVQRRADPGGPPLSRPQQRVLAALTELCGPGAATEVTVREAAGASGVRLGSVVLILRSLADRRLVVHHEGDTEEPEGWSPTLTGRARVRHFDLDAGERASRLSRP